MIYIEVPDENDSLSQIEIGGVSYNLRFQYNETGDYWSFGIYDEKGMAIFTGVKIVPNFPLNLFLQKSNLPPGLFFAESESGAPIGHDAWKNAEAEFVYISWKEAAA